MTEGNSGLGTKY